MNKYGTREEINVSGSVFVYAGVQQNALTALINRGARLTESGLMRGSFASSPDETTGRVQRYATEGLWKQRFLQIEFDTDGFMVTLHRPKEDAKSVSQMNTPRGARDSQFLPSPSTPTERSSLPTSPGSSAFSSPFSSAIKRGNNNKESFSGQMRKIASELDFGDPAQEHIVENRLFKEQIKEGKAQLRTKFPLSEGIIRLRKVYLGANAARYSLQSDGDSSAVPSPIQDTEFFLLRLRNSFNGNVRREEHEFVVQMFLDGGFLEFVGRTDDNSHLWYQRLQSIVAIHNAFLRVKKMLLNRQMFPVLPGRDEFPIARLVKVDDGTSNDLSATVNGSFSGMATYASGGNFLSQLNNQQRRSSNVSSVANMSSSARQRYVLQMVLCKMSISYSRKGFDLTFVGRAVSGQTLYWRIGLDDIPIIHEADQYATVLAVPLTSADVENISLGSDPKDELFLCQREPETLRILRGGSASERVGPGTAGLFYLNKWATFLSVFSRLHTASHPTAFQQWGEGGGYDDASHLANEAALEFLMAEQAKAGVSVGLAGDERSRGARVDDRTTNSSSAPTAQAPDMPLGMSNRRRSDNTTKDTDEFGPMHATDANFEMRRRSSAATNDTYTETDDEDYDDRHRRSGRTRSGPNHGAVGKQQHGHHSDTAPPTPSSGSGSDDELSTVEAQRYEKKERKGERSGHILANARNQQHQRGVKHLNPTEMSSATSESELVSDSEWEQVVAAPPIRRERSRRIVHDGSMIGAELGSSQKRASPEQPHRGRQPQRPVNVPGASSVPGLDTLNANFVERLNSFRTLRTIATEATGLSAEAASFQATEGAEARRRRHRAAEGTSSSGRQRSEALMPHAEDSKRVEQQERSQMDALAIKFSEGKSLSPKSGSKSPERQRREEAKRIAAEAERVAARLQQKGVSNVTVSARPTSTQMVKEATLRDPSPRSHMPRDERKVMSAIPLQFLEGKHEEAMLAIMGFWQKYPPLVPPID